MNSRRGFKILRFVSAFLFLAAVGFVASCSFLEDEEFFDKVESEVKVANADKMEVYIRYANIRFGKASPVDASYYTVKNNVAFSVTATTNTDYGFYKWAAFSTNTFNPANQYSELVYNNDEEYNEKFASLELPDTVVHFSDKNSPGTNVTIYTTRNDIWLVPIIANRPVISNTFPDEKTNPVRNASLRIQFSKPMDEASFAGNYTVGEGNLTGEFELNLKDITDLFEIKLSESKKLVTFSFKAGSGRETTGFNPSSNVQISFTDGITDIYGYKMASSTSKKWTIGTGYDRAAPVIETLSGGINSSFNTFTSVDTSAANAASTSLDDALYTDSLLAQRTNGKVNIYVYSQDIVEGNATRQESDVQMIGFRAASYTDMDGNALDVGAAENSIAKSYESYAALLNNSEVGGEFSSLMNAGGGCLYTYDISSLPDGLVKIDVWAVDMTGNNGLENYSDSLGNGYKSIFVVKDTHAPDIASQVACLKSSSRSAPFGWYRNSASDPIVMYDESPNLIVDMGHEKLRSRHSNMKWVFRLGDGLDWAVAGNDASWKSLSERYSLGNARVDADGVISLTFKLMDDLGNMSPAAAISSVSYDNTAPVISPLSWVGADDSTALNASTTPTIPDSIILKAPFVEEMSGVKAVRVEITSASGSVSNPLSGASILSAANSDSPLATIAADAAELNYATGIEVSTIQNNMLILGEAVKSGNLYFKNLKLGTAQEKYTVKLTFYDSALNESASQTITICHDATSPLIKEVTVVDLATRTSKNGVAEESLWLPFSAYDSTTKEAVKARVSVKVDESVSGVYTITLSDNAYLTDSSYIRLGGVDGTALVNGVDFTLDTAGNKIVMSDMFAPKILGTDFVFLIENVSLNSANNTVGVTLHDFATNNANGQKTGIQKDSDAPVISNILLEDSGAESGKLQAQSDADGTHYTSSSLVTLKISGAKDGSSGSGIHKIVIDSGAEFTDSTAVSIEGGSSCPITKNSSTEISFNTAYVDDMEKVFVITNVKLPDGADGARSVTAHIVDMCGWTSVQKSDSIVLDTTLPDWLSPSVYVATSGNTAGKVYPASGSEGKQIGTDYYFYTSESSVKLSVSYQDTNFYGAKYSGTTTDAAQILANGTSIAGGEAISFDASGSTTYSVVLCDKAGNVSDVRSFHVIYDNSITTNADSTTASLAKKMSKHTSGESSGYKVYLEKQAYSGVSYRNRFSTSDGQVISVAFDLSDYTEKTSTVSQSGLAYFAINDSTAAPSENGTAGAFNKWIPYSSENSSISVTIPSTTELRGPYYLWLKDNVGNANYIQIRTQASETAGKDELWQGKAAVSKISTIDFVNGTSTDGSYVEEGKLVTSSSDTSRGNITYYNNSAKYGFAYDESNGILFSGTAEEDDYPIRFALVKKAVSSAPSKSDVTTWIYPDSVSGTAYTFTNKDYPQGIDGANYEYLYYIMEDAVGNICTDAFNPSGASVVTAWKYDNDAPKITLADGVTIPSAVTKENVPVKLVPPHYGKKSYYGGTGDTIWLPKVGSVTDSVSAGTNTRHGTAKSLYFDLAIEESTKITQFCYDSNENVSASTEWSNTVDFNFKVDTSVSSISAINEGSEAPLYLHVRDILGNVATSRLSSDGKFRFDNAAPDFASEITPVYKLKQSYYYAAPIKSSGSDYDTISVALSGTAYAQNSVLITLPLTWFSDDSSVYAYSLENPGNVPNSIYFDIGDTDNPSHSPCIVLQKGTHYTDASDKSFNLYIYDSVGNYKTDKTVSVKTRVDTVSPTFKLAFDIAGSATFIHPQLNSSVTVDLSGKTGSIYDAIQKTTASGSLNVNKEYVSTSANENEAGYSENKPYIIYAAPDSTYLDSKYYFIGEFTASDTGTTGTTTGGISDIKVDRKLGSNGSWTENYLKMSNLNNVASDTAEKYVANVPIDLDSEGRTYRITVSDYAGNSTTVFIDLFLDKTAPTFTEKPTVTATKGSVNTDGTNYYFNEMNISFTAKDQISQTVTDIASGVKNYSLIDVDGSSETELKAGSLADGTEITLTATDFASHTSRNKLSVKVGDNLGNSGSSNLYVGTTEVTKPWIRDTEAPSVSDVADKEYTGARIVTVTETKTLYYTPKVRSNDTDYSIEEFNVTVNATDTLDGTTAGKVRGYFVSNLGTLGNSSPTINPYTSLESATDGSATLKIKPSNYFVTGTAEGIAYIYAVDYANNISQAFTLQIKKDPNKPVISNVSFTNAVTDVSNTQKYFNSGSKVTFTVRDNSVNVREYGLYYSKLSDPDWTKYGNVSINLSKGVANTYTLNMAELPKDEGVYLYLYAKNNSSTTTYFFLPVDIEGEIDWNTAPIWTYDETADRPTSVLSPAENVKTYPRGTTSISNDGTLYYNQSIASETVNLTVTFPADPTGIKGYKLYNGTNTTAIKSADFETPLAAGTSGTATIPIELSKYTSGKVKICSVDGLDNVTDLDNAFILNLSEVTAAKDISSVTVSKNEDGAVLYQDTTTGKYYYNGAATSLTLTPTMGASDPTGIVGFTTSSSATAPDTQSSATYYSKEALSSDGVDSVTLYAVNGVGCVSANPITVTLIRDSTAPSISTVSLNNINNGSLNNNAGRIYYNPANVTVSVSASDRPASNYSGIENYALTTSDVSPASDSADWKNATSLTLPSNQSGSPLYLYVKDKVGNIASQNLSEPGITITYTPMSGTSVNVTTGVTLASDETAPSAAGTSIALTTLTNGNSVYLETSTSTSLYYTTGITSVEITPSLASADASLMGYRLSETGTSVSPTVNIPLSNNETSKIYAVDYAGNITEVYSLTTISAETVPDIVSVEVKALDGSDSEQTIYDDSSSSHYYDENAVKVRITPKFAAGTDTSFIAGFKLSTSSDTPAAYYDYTARTSDGSATIKLVAVNKVGAVSAEYSVTLVRDGTAPTEGTLAFKISGTDGHSINASGTSLFYNSGKTSVSVTGAASDSGSGIKEYAFDSASEVSGSTVWTSATAIPSTITIPSAGGKFYLHIKDNLNHILDLPLAENANYVGYDNLQHNVTDSLTWVADAEVPAAPGSFTLSVTDGEGIYFDSVNKKLYYSTTVLGSTTAIDFTPAADSSVLGWSLINDGTGIGSTVSVTLADGSYVSIYAVDYAGNFSEPYTFTMVKKDSISAITYGSGETFKVQMSSSDFVDYCKNSITVASEGAVKYAVSNTTSTPATWTDLSGAIDLTSSTGDFYLFVKDNVGNTGYSKLHKYTTPASADGGLKYFKDGGVLYISNLPESFTLKSVSITPALAASTKYEMMVNKTAVTVSNLSSNSLEFTDAMWADGGVLKITAGDGNVYNSLNITKIELRDGDGVPISTASPVLLETAPTFNILSQPTIFSRGSAERISTFRSKVFSRSISYDDLIAEKEAESNKGRTKASKASSAKNVVPARTSTPDSTVKPVWGGLGKDFDSEANALDLAVSRLRSSNENDSVSQKSVSKLKESVEQENKSVIETKVNADSKLSPSNAVSVKENSDKETPFGKIVLLSLAVVLGLSCAVFAKKYRNFLKKKIDKN